MGPEEQKRNFMIYCNGQPVAEFSRIDEMAEITITDPDAEPAIIGALGPVAFSARISIPKQWRCRSRKRFIKLLMAHGCPRNDAAEIAAIPSRAWQGLSFQSLFFHTMAMLAAEQQPDTPAGDSE